MRARPGPPTRPPGRRNLLRCRSVPTEPVNPRKATIADADLERLLLAKTPQADIAKILGVTDRTVRRRIREARAVHGKAWGCPIPEPVPPHHKARGAAPPVHVVTAAARDLIAGVDLDDPESIRRAAMAALVGELVGDDVVPAARELLSRIPPPKPVREVVDHSTLVARVMAATAGADGMADEITPTSN